MSVLAVNLDVKTTGTLNPRDDADGVSLLLQDWALLYVGFDKLGNRAMRLFDYRLRDTFS